MRGGVEGYDGWRGEEDRGMPPPVFHPCPLPFPPVCPMPFCETVQINCLSSKCHAMSQHAAKCRQTSYARHTRQCPPAAGMPCCCKRGVQCAAQGSMVCVVRGVWRACARGAVRVQCSSQQQMPHAMHATRSAVCAARTAASLVFSVHLSSCPVLVPGSRRRGREMRRLPA